MQNKLCVCVCLLSEYAANEWSCGNVIINFVKCLKAVTFSETAAAATVWEYDRLAFIVCSWLLRNICRFYMTLSIPFNWVCLFCFVENDVLGAFLENSQTLAKCRKLIKVNKRTSERTQAYIFNGFYAKMIFFGRYFRKNAFVFTSKAEAHSLFSEWDGLVCVLIWK